MSGYLNRVELLDNPVWNSLATRHAHWAVGYGGLRRYPAAIAPFVSTEEAETSAAACDELVSPGERVVLISVRPAVPKGWEIMKEFSVAQYVWQAGCGEGCEEAIVLHGAKHLDNMMELTDLVYPAYFRRGTPSLGDYFGIYRDGRLVAMAGIRMAMPGFQEISAICTHPEFRGQGLASRLTRHLIAHIVGQDEVPFLHTETDNFGAQAVYEKLGFAQRRELTVQVWLRPE